MNESERQAIVLSPDEEAVIPLLLYRGNMSFGRAQSLLKFFTVLMERNVTTTTEAVKQSRRSFEIGAYDHRDRKVSAAAHTSGLHTIAESAALESFLSRLRDNPDVTNLVPHLTEFAGDFTARWAQPGSLIRIDRWAASKHHLERGWRWRPKEYKQQRGERHTREAPAEPVPMYWPYVQVVEPANDYELVLAVDAVVPKGLPPQIREDICQDLIVAVLSDEVSIENLKSEMPKFISKVFRQYPIKYGHLSLDEPPPWHGFDDDRTLLDTLKDGMTALWREPERVEVDENEDLWFAGDPQLLDLDREPTEPRPSRSEVREYKQERRAAMPITRRAFEEAYAERSGVTLEWLHQRSRHARPCNCGSEDCEGWQMVNINREKWPEWSEFPESDPRFSVQFGEGYVAEPEESR